MFASMTREVDQLGEASARVVLKPRKAQPFFGRHPWVFEGAIQYVDGDCADGDVVNLLTDKGNFVARGVINTRSKLHIRLYTWDETQRLDASFWRQRLESAIQLRRDLPRLDRQAMRMVFSETDGLSGLIVDRYLDHLVVQLNALAMAVRWPVVEPLLIDLLHPRSIVLRGDPSIAKEEGIELQTGAVWGESPTAAVEISEHGVTYVIDLYSGQKTGLYLDQAENHRTAASYLNGRRVLDLFCYTGGFSLAAARLGTAAEVLGIDGSERAIAAAQANAARNGIENVRFEVGDGFRTLDDLRTRGEKFGAVILDPPKFARTRRQVDEALRAYHRINRLAVDLLEPGGILVTCSCSGGVSREDFLLMISGVAQKSGRSIHILEQLGAAPDHPISVTCPETEYLKCFICRVG
jgi:23S rRNA (cytosine1962-C5)-methyltransferase